MIRTLGFNQMQCRDGITLQNYICAWRGHCWVVNSTARGLDLLHVGTNSHNIAGVMGMCLLGLLGDSTGTELNVPIHWRFTFVLPIKRDAECSPGLSSIYSSKRAPYKHLAFDNRIVIVQQNGRERSIAEPSSCYSSPFPVVSGSRLVSCQSLYQFSRKT